jgi:hypothetical protein
LSTTSIVASNISSIHMPLLDFKSTWFSYGADFLLCGLGVGGRFSLLNVGSTACKSNMLLHLLWKIIKFMIVYFLLVLAFNNLVECILAPLMIYLFLPCKQP